MQLGPAFRAATVWVSAPPFARGVTTLNGNGT